MVAMTDSVDWSAEDAEAFLTDLIREGIKYGLEHFRLLLDQLEHPEAQNPWIHVAGTNGKGSTTAMVEAILRAHGLATTMFTSPHLVSVRERFRVDGRTVPGDLFAAAAAPVARASSRLVDLGQDRPTFFEANTALVFELAARRSGSWGVAEVGLGGRLDATNVLTPEAAAITSIGLDHMKTLGPTRERIAYEKAGVAKPGIPLLVADVGPGPLSVIEAEAARRGAPVEVVRPRTEGVRLDREARRLVFDLHSGERRYPGIRLPLLGAHQLSNTALAVRLVEVAFARRGLAIDAEAVVAGLSEVWWPARFDIREGDPQTVLDAVHNPEGMVAFEGAWREVFGNTRAVVLFGACGDKSLTAMLSPLARIASTMVFAQSGVKRAAPASDLLARWHQEGHGYVPAKAEADLQTAWDKARTIARNEGRPLVVCGSLYLLGDLMKLPDGPPVDRPLPRPSTRVA